MTVSLEEQNLRFVVLSVKDKNSQKIEDQKTIGEVYCTLVDLIYGVCEFPLIKEGDSQGILIISCDEVPGFYDFVEFSLHATNLDKKELLRKSGM